MTVLSFLYNVLWIMRFSTLAGGGGRAGMGSGQVIFLALWEHQVLVPLILLRDSSTASVSFLMCTHSSVPCWILEGNPLQVFGLLCDAHSLSSPVLCPANSSHPGYLKISVSIFKSECSPGSTWVFPPCAMAWKLSLGSQLGQLQGAVFYLSKNTILHWLMLNILKIIVPYIFFSLFKLSQAEG